MTSQGRFTRQELVAKSAHLSLWEHGVYTVIAESEAQCWELYAEETGDEDIDPDSSWRRLDDDERVTICLDGDGDITSVDDGAPVDLPAWVWVAKYGKARYLCSEA